MVRTLVQLMRTLDKMPEEVKLSSYTVGVFLKMFTAYRYANIKYCFV